MAKGVYDALRRADEERRRKTEGEVAPAAPVAPLEWERPEERPPPQASAPPVASERGRVPFWRRWLSRGRDAAQAQQAIEATKRRYTMMQPDSHVSEQFRMLRGRLDSLAAQRPVRTVAIASANPGEGKSTAAINLAVVTAMGVGRSVLLIDCDLRQPRIHHSLGLVPKAGLAEVLTQDSGFEDARLKVENLSLDVLGVRGCPPNPSELLASDGMRRLVEEVGQRYDRVILDTPATLGLPDSKIISELCDGIVMIVRADVTPREDVYAALEVLDRRRVLGTVLNGVASSGERYGYY